MSKLTSFFNHNRFTVISWAVTIALVAGMIGGALRWKGASSVQALAPIPTAGPNQDLPKITMPALGNPEAFKSIAREIQLKTNVPADKPRYKPVDYHVKRGILSSRSQNPLRSNQKQFCGQTMMFCKIPRIASDPAKF